jgi:hypothetical protein
MNTPNRLRNYVSANVVSPDGANQAFVTPASTAPLATDPALVVTISPNSSATGAGTGVAQGSTTSGQSGPLVQGAVTTSAPTYTTGKTDPLSLDTSGNLRVSATGTVTAAQSTAANLKGEMILLDAAGTNLATVKAASTAPASTDTALVVSLNPLGNVIIDPSFNSPQLIGTITATTSKNNNTTAVGFVITAGSRLLLQSDTACYVLAGTTSGAAAASTTGVLLAANQERPWYLLPTEAYIAVIAVSGTSNVKVWTL